MSVVIEDEKERLGVGREQQEEGIGDDRDEEDEEAATVTAIELVAFFLSKFAVDDVESIPIDILLDFRTKIWAI